MENLFEITDAQKLGTTLEQPLRLIGCLLILSFLPGILLTAAAKETKPAELKISGYGFFGDRELKRMLTRIELSEGKPEFFDENFIEDAVLLLMSHIKRDGYLRPVIRADVVLDDGRKMSAKWDQAMEETSLPRPLRLRKVHFRIREGVLYHYKKLRFDGLKTVREKQARSFFIETGGLIALKANRIYNPEQLDGGLASLTDMLTSQGYENARAVVADLSIDDKTGAIRVTIQVEQGRKSVVRSVRQEFSFEDEAQPSDVRTLFPDQPYSKPWLQDFIQGLKTNSYHHGYPDARVDVETLKREPVGELIQVDLLASIKSGPQVSLGKVKFQGEKKTKEAMMKRRVRLKEGSLLDRIQAEQGRHRLATLGAFDSVQLSYEPVDEPTRDLIYEVKEGKRIDLSLLFGYGSYELLRGGIELDQNNIWGRAHRARLRLVQSFKASSGEYTYTMPEFVGEDVDVFLNAAALRRQEISFLRQEYGGGFGAHKYFRGISSDATVRYNYSVLSATEAEGFAIEGPSDPSVGAVILDLKHDRRDSPLYPHRGYKVFSNLEWGARSFGGDVNYERVQIAASGHAPLGGGRYVSLGLSHGVAVTPGSSAENLPFNRRFFPGGENSIRGYREGEASPRNADGKIVGAETFSLATLEIEQALTPTWSVVVFSDALGFAHEVKNYPFDTGLYSVGGGLRWRTVVGPVRLEYGYNLNRRAGDPAGTFHFSLGFPF